MQHKVHVHAEWLLAQHNNVEFYLVMRSHKYMTNRTVLQPLLQRLQTAQTTTGCLQLQTCNRMFVHLLSIFLAHAYVWKLHSGQTQGIASLSYLCSTRLARVACETIAKHA